MVKESMDLLELLRKRGVDAGQLHLIERLPLAGLCTSSGSGQVCN